MNGTKLLLFIIISLISIAIYLYVSHKAMKRDKPKVQYISFEVKEKQ